jgi:hypothetical protein
MDRKMLIIGLCALALCLAVIGAAGKATAEQAGGTQDTGADYQAHVNQTSKYNQTSGGNCTGNETVPNDILPPAPQPPWDGILDQLKNIPGAIWNWIIDAFNTAIQTVIWAIFQLFIILFKSPPLVDNAPLVALWSQVVMIMDALLGIVFAGIGITYLWSGVSPSTKAEVKLMLPNLLVMLILGHASIYICQFVLDLNDAMVEAVLGDGFAKYQPQMPPSAGIAFILLAGIVLIIIILVGIVLAMRVVIILFTTVLMPIACLCYVFPITRGFAKTIFTMFATWSFLTFFESIVLVVAFIALGTMNQWVAWLIFIAALAFMVSLPKMLTKGMGSAGGSGAGSILGITAVAGTVAMAATGVGAGVAGAAGAMKGGMGAAGAAGKSFGGQMVSGFAKAPGGFARGFSGAAQKWATAMPKAGLGKLTNPVKTFRQEYEQTGGATSQGNANATRAASPSKVAGIRQKYGLRNKTGVTS